MCEFVEIIHQVMFVDFGLAKERNGGCLYKQSVRKRKKFGDKENISGNSATDALQVQNFGEPFSLVIREGETLADVKMRIQKKLQVSDEEFLKWKFALLSLGRPDYLLDSDVVSSRFQRRDVYGAWKQYLGLEHPNNTPKELCCKL
ncbi:ubiquitin C-terminal hydrolase 13-like isoform X2 [Daucus carota subsp. sativus]|uniref:ubiquitin C-terminal hydrolase 13-like isoform X2 n=1 Tax=Daucus carota subsp. sativus TaxID=79200 RepID=UPI003083ECF8